MIPRYSLAVTSVEGGAGRTLVSKSIAEQVAKAGHSVVWVGADLASGPIGPDVDLGLRTLVFDDAPPWGNPPAVFSVGVSNLDDLAWSWSYRDTLWPAVISRLLAHFEVLIFDAPPLFGARELLLGCEHAIVLLPADRQLPKLMSLVPDFVQALRDAGAKLSIDGVVMTRCDPSRQSAGVMVNAMLDQVPAEAWLPPIVPEGPGSLRELALEELGLRWSARVGLQPLATRAQSETPREAPVRSTRLAEATGMALRAREAG